MNTLRNLWTWLKQQLGIEPKPWSWKAHRARIEREDRLERESAEGRAFAQAFADTEAHVLEVIPADMVPIDADPPVAGVLDLMATPKPRPWQL